ADRSLLPNREVQAADGKEIRRGTEVQVEVDTAGEIDRFCIESPATRVESDLDPNRFVSQPTGNPARSRSPIRVTDDLIVQSTDSPIVEKNRGAEQLPARIDPGDTSGLVPRPIEPPPENRACHPSPQHILPRKSFRVIEPARARPARRRILRGKCDRRV